MAETDENPVTEANVEAKIRAYAEDESYEVVTICGSMRFYPEMLIAASKLTLEGAIVLLPLVVKDGEMTAAQKKHQHEIEQALPDGINLRIFLDAMHRFKIDMAHRIVVVTNYQHYIGDSTKAEIAYAVERAKNITFDTYPVRTDR